MSIDRMGQDFTLGEARDLLIELMRESGSHLFADMAGYDLAASQSDLATILHAEWYMNVHRDRKKHKKDIQLPRPWSEKKPNAGVTPERRAELVAELERRSALSGH